MKNEGKIKADIETFRKLMNQKNLEFSPQNIWNSDQISVCYELHRMRTLSDKGEKITLLFVQRENAVTHSITVMPVINENGLFGKLYICLKETSNSFGPIIQKQIDALEKIFPFVKLVCSTSGKLNNGLMKIWVDEVFTPSIAECHQQNEENLLLLDSWGGHWNAKVWEGTKRIQKEKIPENCTGKLQPLDVGVNSYFKYILKRFTDFIIFEELDCTIGIRENLVKLVCLAFNQLSAEVFEPLLKYSWIKAGLHDKLKEKFIAPKDVLFRKRRPYCEIPNCSEITLIRCGHCFTSLCFNHFFVNTHVH